MWSLPIVLLELKAFSPSWLALLLEIELGCLALGEAAFSADYEGRSLCLVHHWLKADPGFRAGRHQKWREESGPRKSSSSPHGRREILTTSAILLHAQRVINDSEERAFFTRVQCICIREIKNRFLST